MHSPDPFAPTTLGERLGERDRGWFGITEARHELDDHLHAHTHRYPAITIVSRGSFGLHIGGETVDCDHRGVFFKRGEHRHSNQVGRGGSDSLILEIRTDRDRIDASDLPLPDGSFWTHDPTALRLSRSIRREFENEDSASDLALEGLVLELIASLLRREAIGRPDSQRPAWLAEAEAMLHERFRDGLGLKQVADHVGRHPAHLARSFRRHHGCSVGEYLRRVRVDHAEQLSLDGALIVLGHATDVLSAQLRLG